MTISNENEQWNSVQHQGTEASLRGVMWRHEGE